MTPSLTGETNDIKPCIQTTDLYVIVGHSDKNIASYKNRAFMLVSNSMVPLWLPRLSVGCVSWHLNFLQLVSNKKQGTAFVAFAFRSLKPSPVCSTVNTRGRRVVQMWHKPRGASSCDKDETQHCGIDIWHTQTCKPDRQISSLVFASLEVQLGCQQFHQHRDHGCLLARTWRNMMFLTHEVFN